MFQSKQSTNRGIECTTSNSNVGRYTLQRWAGAGEQINCKCSAWPAICLINSVTNGNAHGRIELAPKPLSVYTYAGRVFAYMYSWPGGSVTRLAAAMLRSNCTIAR